MYISKIRIEHFRNFKDTEILFNENLNIIIGANNSGKTNLLKALALVVDVNTNKRLSIFDFNRVQTFEELKQPPEVKIKLTLSQTTEKESDIDSLAMVAKWLVKLENPFEAQLTYHFYLPIKDRQEYDELYKRIHDDASIDPLKKSNELWKNLDRFLLRKYISKIYGGLLENQYVAESDTVNKFDFQFLDAIRDVERDMLSGKSKLLKEVLDFFIDYDIKNDNKINVEEKQQKILQEESYFEDNSTKLISAIRARLKAGKNKIFEYENDLGSTGKISFDGNLTEAELFGFLGLVIDKAGISLPATHNGLGYNNLIFMALILAKMQVDSNGSYLGSNAKSYPVLVVEEPEAHLHPSMQYKLIESINKNLSEGKTKQVFITSHSPNITAKAELENIICLEYDTRNRSSHASYPARVFPKTEGGQKSKKYVQRFLDVTRSDLLFANKVILVEGIAEELLVNTFAKYLDKDLTAKHIAILNVGGRYFEHFLYLFGSDPTTKKYALAKKVMYLTDRDHMRLEIDKDSKLKSCYPVEHDIDKQKYSYGFNPHLKQYEEADNIKCFTQVNSSTFEYDLIMHNPSLKLLLSTSMSNVPELNRLMDLFDKENKIDELIKELSDSKENKRIEESLLDDRLKLCDKDKKKHLIAARYLNSISKGEHALDLQYALEENLLKKDNQEEFVVPEYIKDALEWIYHD